MKHRGNHTTSLLFIFLLVTIGIGGKTYTFWVDNSLDRNQFQQRFCRAPEVRHWPPAKRQLCNKGVYINTDSATALEYLPQIGPTRARAIVKYRDVHGPFKSLRELTNVNGIGPKILSSVKPWIEDVPKDRMPYDVEID